MKPISFHEHVNNTEHQSMGIQSFITDKMLSHMQNHNPWVKPMVDSIIRFLTSNGKDPINKIDIEKRRNESLGGYYYSVIVDTVNSKDMMQYCYMVYTQWGNEYTLRLNWENKSLWQYIKYWWDRNMRLGQ